MKKALIYLKIYHVICHADFHNSAPSMCLHMFLSVFEIIKHLDLSHSLVVCCILPSS